MSENCQPPAKKPKISKKVPKTLDLTPRKHGSDVPGYEGQKVCEPSEARSLKSTVLLHNGVHLPVVGFGTYKLKTAEVVDPLKVALGEGYVLVDSAQVYDNEREVGQVLAAKPRYSYFIETKLWRSSNNYDRCLTATRESVRLLQVDYLDLYIMHWPGCKSGYPLKKGVTCPPDWKPSMRNDTWRAMEDLYLAGKARAIGVSNFSIRHLENLMETCRIKPMVLQVEFHPKLIQGELLRFCQKNEIQLQAYASLGSGDTKNGKGSFFTMPGVPEAAKKYNKTPAQILLRWALEKNVCIVPKSANAARIAENTKLFDFELTSEDMELIDSNGENVMERNTWGGLDPDTVE